MDENPKDVERVHEEHFQFFQFSTVASDVFRQCLEVVMRIRDKAETTRKETVAVPYAPQSREAGDAPWENNTKSITHTVFIGRAFGQSEM